MGLVLKDICLPSNKEKYIISFWLVKKGNPMFNVQNDSFFSLNNLMFKTILFVQVDVPNRCIIRNMKTSFSS